MPFTHHSHSGQFCSHARDTLSEMLSTGIKSNMSVMALTEHVPRSNKDLYDEETAEGTDEAGLHRRFDGFVAEAQLLRDSKTVAASRTSVLIGFEGEWIDQHESRELVRHLQRKHEGVFDFFVGSVHHVASVPIDVGRARYERARDQCGGTDEGLFEGYFDAQHRMLTSLEPFIVGHFDLIRLLSDRPNLDLRNETSGGEHGRIWQRVIRNLEVVKGYGGVLECNSSGLRKGLKEPYPTKAVCEAWNRMGGLFVLSDDSHGIDQVGACYKQALEFLRGCGVDRMAYLERQRGETVVKDMLMAEIEELPFWAATDSAKGSGIDKARP